MKQHITKEQLDELSNGQRDALREWWISRSIQGEERFTWLTQPYGEVLYPRLSIGQMIEFLLDQEDLTFEGIKRQHNGYCVWVNCPWIELGDSEVGTSQDEICDALWEMVKRWL